ncbi:hypothetical protein MEO_02341, partial [Candida albicans P94015]
PCTTSTETTPATESTASTETASSTPVESTVIVPSTTVITVSSCYEDKCSVSSVTTGVVTISSEETIYTTYCPITSSITIPVPNTSTPAAPGTPVESQPVIPGTETTPAAPGTP